MNDSNIELEHEDLYQKSKFISNRIRFKMIELTSKDSLTITHLSQSLKLAYNKCADYVRILDDLGLVTKTKVGKEVFVKSKIVLKDKEIVFER